MKTIDLLVKALPAIGGWPEKVTHIGQDYDRELMFYGRGNVRTGIILDQLAVDHRECGGVGTKITREQYEAALAAKIDGWIEWGGGKHPPVSTNTVVDVKLEKGYVQSGYPAGEYSWEHIWQGSNIIAYRLRHPQEAEQSEADDEVDLNECIGQDASPAWSGEGLPPVGVECEYSLNGGKTWWNCKVDYIVGTQGVVMLCDTFEGVQYVQFSSYGNALKFRPTRSEEERKREKAVQALCNAGGGNGRVDEESGYGSCWFDVYDAIAAGKIPGVKLED